MEIKISYKLKDNYVELWADDDFTFSEKHTFSVVEELPETNESKIKAQKELEEKFKHFNDNYLDYKKVGDTLVYDPNHNGMANAQAELEKQPRIAEIKIRLIALSEDIAQEQAGEVVPNIEARKAEFVTLHNELRELLGLEARAKKE